MAMEIITAIFITVYVSCMKIVCVGSSGNLPNFVIIIADDLGIGDLGCFGNTSLKTPNLDRLALEGAKFTHSLAPAELCTPSRSAVLTGRYPIRSGMTSAGLIRVFPWLAAMGGLPQSETTFAKILQETGYRTALIGKWHLGLHCKTPFDFCHHPKSHGFDYFYGLPWSTSKDFGGEVAVNKFIPNLDAIAQFVTSAALAAAGWLLQNGQWMLCVLVFIVGVVIPELLVYVATHLYQLNGVVMRNFDVIEQPVRLTGLVNRFVDEAQNFLTTQGKDPFLLFLPLTHVHTSLSPAKPFRGTSSFGFYGDSVLEMDWAIGQVLNQLDKLNLTENTMVLFTSDQGGHLEEKTPDGARAGGFNGIFKGGKGMAGMDGALRVPTLIRWPAMVKAGIVISEPTSLMDIFPTIMDIIQKPLPFFKKIDGKSLMPFLTLTNANSDGRFFVHHCGELVHAVRWQENETAIWKVHYYWPAWLPGTTECSYMCPCQGGGTTKNYIPIVYNIAIDPSEDNPLNTSDPKIQEVLRNAASKLLIHQSGILPNENQFNLVNLMYLPWLQPCCNFPSCQCLEEKYPDFQ